MMVCKKSVIKVHGNFVEKLNNLKLEFMKNEKTKVTNIELTNYIAKAVDFDDINVFDGVRNKKKKKKMIEGDDLFMYRRD